MALARGYAGMHLVPLIVRLLAEGEPVSAGRIAHTADMPESEVEQLLAALPTAERDPDGRLLGLGLSLVASPHRYSVRGRTLYAWCASDAPLFPIMLGEPAHIESTCPATGHTVSVDATPARLEHVEPTTAVVSAQLPDQRSPTSSGSANGHFFTSAEAAQPWLTEHPLGHLSTVRAEFEKCRHIAASLGWTEPPRDR